MPQYQVWYKGNEEPFEFASIGRLSDAEIVGKILEKEHIIGFLITDKNRGQAGDVEPPLSETIQRNGLTPVKYTMDESEMIVIG
ncbi:hypothetical protein [Duganella sp. S19_KUP01_CR8]|uniref:hypothetical protein n=1 Tax=Duganella sp. S19_KUP01_CR8 TaxID=3025502 RepID=UPI002FCDA251